MNYEATTWPSRLADLEAAVQMAQRRSGQTPVVLGVRLGGTLALAAAVKRGTPMAGLVVWEPVVDPAQYVHQLLRVNVSTQMVALGKIERDRSDLIADARRGGIVSVNGFGLSGPFIDALLALDLDSKIGQLSIPTLWLSTMSADQTVAIESLSCGKACIDLSLLEGTESPSLGAPVISRGNHGMAGLRSAQPRCDAVSRTGPRKRCRSPARATSSAGRYIAPTARTEGDTAIVILNQGPLDRSGAHRSVASSARRRWAAHGFPVLRFDARGVGDSEGDWAIPEDGAPIKLLYKNIEEGALDTRTRALPSITYARTTSARNVVLTGVCGGAVSALHAAAEHPAVVGVIMVGMPVRPWADIGIDSIVSSQVEHGSQGLRQETWRDCRRGGASSRARATTACCGASARATSGHECLGRATIS